MTPSVRSWRQGVALAVTLPGCFLTLDVDAAVFKATLIVLEDDPRLERSRVERAYFGHPTGSAADAVALALQDASFELDAAGTQVTLEIVRVASTDAARASAQKAEKGGAAAVLTDLDAQATLAVVDAVKLPVLNLGDASDRLREQDCRATLLHVLPSERMRADALAQMLAGRRWSQVLLLTGPSTADEKRGAVALAALKRYGLKLVASKAFKLSADPREREQANALLLTGGTSYDVVWVVDSDGEFARSLPYRTALPRPVVGDGGLAALAFHASFERYGAPQLARRFAKAAGRAMSAHDWAAWMAGKALVSAAVGAPKGPVSAFHKALAGVTLDGYKGVAMSFRPWDGQLRQPLMLSDGQGVLAMAPIDGILHPKNALDTLGADAPEKLCKARP
jgi:ABC transporter substrate binding protein (PQQ-dependent alcohol dehydrogenase system)